MPWVQVGADEAPRSRWRAAEFSIDGRPYPWPSHQGCRPPRCACLMARNESATFTFGTTLCTFGGMDSATRQQRIVQRLRETERLEVADLALELDTSEVTVRRDLDALASAGALRRVHGGAVSLLLRGEELPFALREIESTPAKERIAQTVAGLLSDGEAVIVDSGTTGLAIARALVGRRLTVVPLSIPAAHVLSASASTTLKVPGGTSRFGEGSLVGPMAEASLRSLRVDTAIISCCGLSPTDGVTAYEIGRAHV